MTRYQWFEEGHGQRALNLGILSTSMFSKYIQYKVYLEHRAAGRGHIEAIEMAAEAMKCGPTTIWKAVYFFVKSPNL